jgi:arabinofuranosyltransferase
VPHPRSRQLLYALGLLVYCVVFFKNAWVGDDAYILFRSLDQLLDGHGPRWNPHERVQVFTCPLWYWLLAGMGSFYRNHYLNSILLSAACNLVLLWNLHKIFAEPRKWLLVVLALAFSQAYFDFTTSGLENPLTYCLLVLAARFYLNHEKAPEDRALLYTATACGLLLVTRHDMLLLVLPLLIHHFWRGIQRDTPVTKALFTLLLPLAGWTLFSLLYYGFPFPNTAYAKLGNIIPRELLLQRGATYFTTSIWRDFISITILPVGIFCGIFSRQLTLRMVALGIALHLAYVWWIGGDFMRGRFFGWDYLLCVIVLVAGSNSLGSRWLNTFNLLAAFLTLIAALSWKLWTPPIATPVNWGAEPFKMGDSADGVTQERYFFFWFTGFPKYLQRQTPLLLDFGWCQDGLEQRRQNLPIAASHTVGMHGFCLGTDRILVDLLGITDPLLARMPRNPSQKNWRPGHSVRLVPEGYCNSIKNGGNHIADPTTAAYYDTIRLLTQSEALFSQERLKAIWSINTGGYSKDLRRIHETMTKSFEQGGPMPQAAGLQDCPFVQLPPALIEQLKHPQT